MNRAQLPGVRVVGDRARSALNAGGPFAALNRKVKLDRLLEASDAIARERGLDPERDAARIFDSMTGRDFDAIVRRAGVNPPSGFTVDCFLGELRRRAGAAS